MRARILNFCHFVSAKNERCLLRKQSIVRNAKISPHHGLAPSIVVEGKDIMVNQDIAIEIKQIPIQDGRVPKH